MFMRHAALPLALAALFAAAPALAQPALTAASPSADAVVSAPTVITLSFTEAVAVPPSSLALVMTAMPSMANHQPMKVTGFATALADEGKTLKVTLPRALPAGTYRLTWHAGSSAGESADGSYSFTVK